MEQRPTRGESLVDGEFAFTADDFRQIAAMLYGDAGIALPEAKATLVYSRLAKRLRALGLESFRDYCALISGRDGLDERQRMLTSLTTNVTRFFREPHHFEHLRDKVLPKLLAEARRGARVRLWSAACSSGEEAYSIALTVLDAAPDAGSLDLKILATDIDREMIARARKGIYGDSAVAPIGAETRRRWLTPATGQHGEKAWSLAPEARALITFREHNLIGDWPMRGPFQAIFCRNVAIYFEEATQAKVWSRFAPLLAPGGRLYIGHSERISGEAAKRLHTDGVTAYRAPGGEARA
jgi:chemotaxis protein methyltransferase CheR